MMGPGHHHKVYGREASRSGKTSAWCADSFRPRNIGGFFDFSKSEALQIAGLVSEWDLGGLAKTSRNKDLLSEAFVNLKPRKNLMHGTRTAW